MLGTAALTKAIVDRSARYTSERDRLSAPRDRAGDLAARAVFFTIADMMKIAIPLGELARRGALPARSLKIVDLGAGCGAMSLGLRTVIEDSEIVAIDRDADALAIAAAVLPRLTTRVGDVTTASVPACDLVVMGTVLNELDADHALAVVTRALGAIPDDGAVIIIEPALRATSRNLHAIRDTVIERRVAHVFAPCTRRSAPCTALIDPEDWCHEDRPLELPPRAAELARLTHLRDGGMKFSYLVLRKQPLDLVDDPGAWRIVSAQRVAKGKLEMIGCGNRGRYDLRLLKRNRTPENRALERADRGDVVVARDAPGEERIEITGPVTITRARA